MSKWTPSFFQNRMGRRGLGCARGQVLDGRLVGLGSWRLRALLRCSASFVVTGHNHLSGEGRDVGTFPAIGRTLERQDSRANRNVLVYPGQCCAAQVFSVTAPYLPPKVFQAAGCGILQLLVCNRVDMPIFPDLVGGHNRETGNLFINARVVDDDAFRQYHGYTRVHV